MLDNGLDNKEVEVKISIQLNYARKYFPLNWSNFFNQS